MNIDIVAKIRELWYNLVKKLENINIYIKTNLNNNSMKTLTPALAKKILVIVGIIILVLLLFTVIPAVSKPVSEPYDVAMDLNAEMWRVEGEIQQNKIEFERLRPQADEINKKLDTLNKKNNELRAQKQQYQARIDSLLETGEDLEVKKE